jgi:ADP-ribose pyrophosphatase
LKPKRVQSKLLGASWRVRFFEDLLKVKNEKWGFARFEIPDFALAVATRSDGRVPLVKQYRNGAADLIWEFPAGFLEEGETPIRCIKREFVEEIGHVLEKPKFVTSVFVSPGRTNQKAHIFSGAVGERTGQDLDDGEDVLVKFVTRGTALKLLKRGGRTSSAHLLAYLLTLGK